MLKRSRKYVVKQKFTRKSVIKKLKPKALQALGGVKPKVVLKDVVIPIYHTCSKLDSLIRLRAQNPSIHVASKQAIHLKMLAKLPDFYPLVNAYCNVDNFLPGFSASPNYLHPAERALLPDLAITAFV